ncbi:hypothetical protein OUZ56_006293 [Daphnia magna]|uniref:Uncharacterized protein n=1 Tax=Daphnia magna TaxID=35525 RepID=A0ABQ9YV89_9CRUS|nr:hypothetical protein OUZ56_006293 [Daphnia magna]
MPKFGIQLSEISKIEVLKRKQSLQGGTWLGFAITFFLYVSLIYPFCTKGVIRSLGVYLMYCGGRKIIQ